MLDPANLFSTPKIKQEQQLAEQNPDKTNGLDAFGIRFQTGSIFPKLDLASLCWIHFLISWTAQATHNFHEIIGAQNITLFEKGA